MAEIAAASPSHRFTVPIYWSRAIGAGAVATIIMTIVGAVLKTNFPKMLGSMILPGASLTTQYIVGGVMHFMIGIIYGIIYAAVVGRLVEWNRVIKGVVYGLAITAIAVTAMPLMSAMMGGGKAQQKAMNPCHPSPAPMASAANPCHPKEAAMNPCHPQQGATNPCHPQGSQAMSRSSNPCHTKSSGGGNPCNPCGGSGGPWSGVISVVNHLVYALALAFVYGKVR